MGSSQSSQTKLLDGVQLSPPEFLNQYQANDRNSTIYRGNVQVLLNQNRKWYEHNHKLIVDELSRRKVEVGLKVRYSF